MNQTECLNAVCMVLVNQSRIGSVRTESEGSESMEEKMAESLAYFSNRGSKVSVKIDGEMQEIATIVRCEDCGYSYTEGFVHERLICEKHPELGEVKGDWFCADCWKA